MEDIMKQMLKIEIERAFEGTTLELNKKFLAKTSLYNYTFILHDT
jgi:hypothetical protein